MAVPAPLQNQLYNGSFEGGDVGWLHGVNGSPTPVTSIKSGPESYDGNYFGEYGPGRVGIGEVYPGGGFTNANRVPTYPGQSITARGYINAFGVNAGATLELRYYTAANVYISSAVGNKISSTQDAWQGYRLSTVSGVTPPGAAIVELAVPVHSHTNVGMVRVDAVSWNYTYNQRASLSSPTNGSTHEEGSVITFSVNTSGTAPVVSVSYYRNGSTLIGTSTAAPYTITSNSLPQGSHSITAKVVFADNSEVTTAAHSISVVEAGEDREFKASNSTAFFVLENFSGLSAAMPSTAGVTGVELEVKYKLTVINRSKDIGVADPHLATSDTIFDAIDGGRFELVLLDNEGSSYIPVGSSSITTVDINQEDFTLVETGTSNNKRWAVYAGAETTVNVGSEEATFGMESILASDFIDNSLGLRFYPVPGTKPSYADTGDGVVRVHLDRVRVRVYFDAGSVEYYFASPDKSQIIKGRLVSAEVMDGNFRTADASGVLQLTYDLEVLAGDQVWIGSDWTIHAAYPPTDANQIGVVGEIDGHPELGMEYNSLPTQRDIKENRSRYQFITENFYGDPTLNSMYGVHGLERAFAYNGEFFYKIYTQPNAEKDMPRSVANHHGHLALGYHGGRVDISVVGQPYNFDGALGASSWAFGDKVVGLLPLSGTILGVFGAKSIWGISGTTVDNFATQVISPNIGATEYTITDMGFPVYANAYGIYTLSQTQQYGDYLGQPMSQSISPWLRPRLLRKPTSDKEVVCAWPVRSKNQYRLAFSDGYVTSMTLNGQQVPTFSFQKYFYQPEDIEEVTDVYTQPAIVPAAVSSELDNHGEERIHIAPYVDEDISTDVPSTACMSLTTRNFGSGGSSTLYGFSSPYPSWWGSQDTSFEIDWFDDNTWHTYAPGDSEDIWELLWGDSVYGVSGRGTLRQSDGTDGGYHYICLDYDIPFGA